ncbi:MAG: flavodoxin family protein, partial [Planctomycetota bacterium]
MARSLIICKSVHHQNTWKVAQAMADVLHAEVVAPEEFPATDLDDYELVGFGSGIYYGGFHPALRNWIRSLPDAALLHRRAFVFSTAGLPLFWRFWHRPLRGELARKGFAVTGEFHCGGFDSWGPLGIFGGINRRHPNEQDLRHAAEFAREMMTKCDREHVY